MKVRIYQGVGPVNLVTPRGEVKVWSGDLILEMQHGSIAIDPETAQCIFGKSVASHLANLPVNSSVDLKEAISQLGKTSSLSNVQGAGSLAGSTAKPAAEPTNSPSNTPSSAAPVKADSKSQTAGSTGKQLW